MGFIINALRPFAEGFSITNTEYASFDNTWIPVWGENNKIRDNHNEMLISLIQEKTNWQVNIRHFTIKDETTEFNLADHKAFWIPADYDTNEFPITTSNISEITALIDDVCKESLAAKAPTPNLAIQTPLMMKSADSLYINIHEAALMNYPAMSLSVNDREFKLSSHLTPDKNENRGYIQTGTVSP
nr:glycoside hydrolase family 97 N-terminal domain-containing protein [Dysgonomonas sp. GY617]